MLIKSVVLQVYWFNKERGDIKFQNQRSPQQILLTLKVLKMPQRALCSSNTTDTMGKYALKFPLTKKLLKRIRYSQWC